MIVGSKPGERGHYGCRSRVSGEGLPDKIERAILTGLAFDLGYQFPSGYNVSLFIDHVSNGGLAKHNQSINDFGLRLGLRF